ncbi:unnamed protein product [Microthlaspi erraticum]|uniref:Uncharacterized protein n=1 Tax=Microthlaspi erraticum TaxID=1685480 RepID=A0A6D2KXX0_9BRAS|nr:unnamed protein product [Microthlaspi erraticum]
MSETRNEDSGAGRSVEGNSNGQRSQSEEALAERHSSDQVESGTPSTTSPPNWDIDDDDDDIGSDNNLPVYLCVANYDDLRPGWNHFAQFTVAVVNTADPKKTKRKANFFDPKDFTSTLLMDAFCSGLKALALEGQTKTRPRLTDTEDFPAPLVRMDGDMFVLADDLLLLLKRAAIEPFLPEVDNGSQTPTKDGIDIDADDNEATERDERRLAELGRLTVERFVLRHIFM